MLKKQRDNFLIKKLREIEFTKINTENAIKFMIKEIVDNRNFIFDVFGTKIIFPLFYSKNNDQVIAFYRKVSGRDESKRIPHRHTKPIYTSSKSSDSLKDKHFDSILIGNIILEKNDEILKIGFDDFDESEISNYLFDKIVNSRLEFLNYITIELLGIEKELDIYRNQIINAKSEIKYGYALTFLFLIADLNIEINNKLLLLDAVLMVLNEKKHSILKIENLDDIIIILKPEKLTINERISYLSKVDKSHIRDFYLLNLKSKNINICYELISNLFVLDEYFNDLFNIKYHKIYNNKFLIDIDFISEDNEIIHTRKDTFANLEIYNFLYKQNKINTEEVFIPFLKYSDLDFEINFKAYFVIDFSTTNFNIKDDTSDVLDNLNSHNYLYNVVCQDFKDNYPKNKVLTSETLKQYLELKGLYDKVLFNNIKIIEQSRYGNSEDCYKSNFVFTKEILDKKID